MMITEAILARLKIDALNPMQVAALAASEQAGDLVILAATGSGKTLAFLLPLLPLLQQEGAVTRAMVVVPSRELAQQIETVFKSMGTGLKITSCYGGHKREIEENNLIEAPAIIVGTPGRIADHLRRGNISANTIEILVLDEYDKSVELGFQEEMAAIVQALPGLKKRVLTSATIAVGELPDYLGMQQPQTLDFLPPEDHVPPAEKLQFFSLLSPDADKIDTLYSLLCFAGNRSAIIFCNHRDAVERTSNLLSEKGIINTFYHGAMEQVDRDSALSKFRNGSVNFLVTTDLASRGLDIPNIRYIVHYHLPHTEDAFIHRNGRTARVEASGTVVILLGPGEKKPAFIPAELKEMELPNEIILPEKPKWVTFFIAAGKKDKVNKIDIVGFLSHKGKLKKEDIGLIDVKDYFSFVAVRKLNASTTLNLIRDEKIKNKKVKIEIAK